MLDILDYIYSHFIVLLLISLICLFTFIALAFKNPFKNKFLNYSYKALMYILSVTFFITAPILNFGYARSFENISIGKTTICAFEKWVPARGKSSGRDARLNVLDKETGIRKERINAGKPGRFIEMRNDTICYLDENDVVLYDAANLKEISRIKEDGWLAILPELIAGVENVGITNGTIDYPVKHYVHFDCLNGKKYWFEPFSRSITTKQPEDVYIPEFSNRSSELVVKRSFRDELKYLYTASNGDGNLEAIIPGPDAKKFFSKIDSTGYIAPFLICIDTVNKMFVFGHYLTTKKETYYLEAKDFEYNTKWKKLSTDIVDSDDRVMDIWLHKNNILYFNIGSYVFAIDPLTFKIHWTTRL